MGKARLLRRIGNLMMQDEPQGVDGAVDLEQMEEERSIEWERNNLFAIALGEKVCAL